MALAKEVGPSGITVNAIEPGVIKTDMNASLDEQTLAELCDETPLCRLGEPEDVAELAYFLASDKASFITGQIIGVDGGFAV
jgi:3-oxoacyl-[acyl-carrier protein] reductase